jgi:hypothetical protein
MLIVGLVAGARSLAAQDHTLGLNLRVVGTAQVGLTILTASGTALRPSLTASWASATVSGFGTIETSFLGVEFDVLFRHSTWDRVSLYSGPGVSLGRSNPTIGESSTIWALRYQLGARLRVVDRVSLFAEADLEYRNSGDSGEFASLATQSLGIIVFLK